MKKLFVLFYALMCLVTLQAQKVTLQDVANGTYRAQSIQGLKPMLDGEHYTQITSESSYNKSYENYPQIRTTTTSKQKTSHHRLVFPNPNH